MTAPTLTREEWLAMRATGLGSSDAAAACGESNVSPAELVLMKRGVMDHPTSLANQEAMDWGTLLQPLIVHNAARRNGLHILSPLEPDNREFLEEEIARSGETEVLGWLEGREAFLRSVKYPWMTATIDGIGHPGDLSLTLVEAKNVGQYHSGAWDTEADLAPPKFVCQLAHQLAVAPIFTAGILAGLVGGNSLRLLRRERVEIEITIEAIITLEAEVWRCVETGDMPAYDGSESHIRALRALHPMDSGETVTLPEEAMFCHRELQALQVQRQERDKRIKQLRLNIEAALGSATFGLLPDGSGVYTNKHQHCREYHVEAKDTPVLRFVKANNWRAEKQYAQYDGGQS